MWHYIVPPGGLEIKVSGETCSFHDFQRQLKVIKEKFNVVSLNHLMEMIRTKKALPPNTLILTFDDGLKNHSKTVLPLLEKLDLTATFFILTSPLMNKMPSTFKIQLIVGEANPKIVREEILPEVIQENHLKRYLQNIRVPSERYRFEEQAIREIKWICNFILEPKDKDKIVDQIFRRVWGNKELELVKKMFMSKSEVITLDRAGMTIGSHGIGHYVMSSLKQEDLRKELSESKNCLENILDHQIDYFSYPSAVSGGKKIWKMTQEANYLAAFEYDPRQKINKPPYNIFALRRIHERDLDRNYLN